MTEKNIEADRKFTDLKSNNSVPMKQQQILHKDSIRKN